MKYYIVKKICFFSFIISSSMFVMGKDIGTSGNVSVINGKVMSTDSVALENSLVSVLSLPDSTLLKSEITDGKGAFSFEITSLPVMLHIEQMGYDKKDLIVEDAESELSIFLSPLSKDLAEFVVKAKRSSMTAKPGMYVYDPRDMYKHFSNAQNMLEFVPLISTFSKEGTKIFSKNEGAKIFINGADPMLPDAVILDKLRAMPPSKIKSVEIIMVPSSMQGQQYMGTGIINIIMDDDYIGWNASVYANTNFNNRRFSEYYISPYWFYQNHNFLFSVSPSYNLNDKKNEYSNSIQSEGKNLLQEIKQNTRLISQMIGAHLTGEYRFGRNSLTGTFGLFSEKTRKTTYYNEKQTTLVEDSPIQDCIDYLYSESFNLSPWSCSLYGAARYSRWFDDEKTAKLDITGTYLNQRPLERSDIMRDFATEDGEPIDQVLFERIQSYRYNTDSWSVVAKFSKSFSDKSVLNVGASTYHNMNHNSYVDPENRYDFRLNKQFTRLNAEYERTWLDFFSTRVGVNQYIINRRIEEGVMEESYKDNFYPFQPYAIMTFTFSGRKNNLMLIYQKQVSMPNDNDLNPYRRWISATEYHVGNPRLKPESGHIIGFQYAWLSQIIISCDYSFGKTHVNGYRYMNSDGYIVETTLPNEEYNNFMAYLGWNKSFFSYRWQLNPSFMLKWKNSSANLGTSELINHSLFYEFSFNNKIRILPRYGLSGELDYRFSGPSRDLTVRYSASHQINLRLRKTLWKLADISGSLSVPLNRSTCTFISPGTEELKIDSFARDIRFSLNFSWSFGKFTIDRVYKVE